MNRWDEVCVQSCSLDAVVDPGVNQQIYWYLRPAAFGNSSSGRVQTAVTSTAGSAGSNDTQGVPTHILLSWFVRAGKLKFGNRKKRVCRQLDVPFQV